MRDYQAIINEVIEVINNNIRYGKSHREIIQSIGDLLANYGLNDVRHFDRVHFKKLTTKSLSLGNYRSYIIASSWKSPLFRKLRMGFF